MYEIKIGMSQNQETCEFFRKIVVCTNVIVLAMLKHRIGETSNKIPIFSDRSFANDTFID